MRKSLLVRSCSDLHLEFASDSFLSPQRTLQQITTTIENYIPSLDSDSETVLVLAGDIVTARKINVLKPLFQILSKRFKHVIYILGNHEHYHGFIYSTEVLIEDVIENALTPDEFIKVTIAGNIPRKVVIDEVTFICGTLWSDMGQKLPNKDKIAATICAHITDFKAIRLLPDKLITPEVVVSIHKKTLAQFKKWMSGIEYNPATTVVCTHFLPSFSAIDPQYLSKEPEITLNHAFATNLDKVILQTSPAYWVFGHTHSQYFGKVGDTQLICNPHGYPSEKNLVQGIYDNKNIFEVSIDYDGSTQRKQGQCI